MSIDTIVKHLEIAGQQDTASRRLGELVVAKGLLAKEIASTQKIAEEALPGQTALADDGQPSIPGLKVVAGPDGLVESAELEERDRCMTVMNGQRCYLRTGHGVQHAFQQELDPFAPRQPFSDGAGLPPESEIEAREAAAAAAGAED